MPEGEKKAAIGFGLAGLLTGAILLLTRKVEAHPENIILSDLAIYPLEVYVGEPVGISLIATNIGEEKATKEIFCEVL